MGVHAVLAPRDRAAGITPTVETVASGAVESVPFIPVTNLARALRELKERGIWLIGADQGAPRDLYSVRLEGPLGAARSNRHAGITPVQPKCRLQP